MQKDRGIIVTTKRGLTGKISSLDYPRLKELNSLGKLKNKVIVRFYNDDGTLKEKMLCDPAGLKQEGFYD